MLKILLFVTLCFTTCRCVSVYEYERCKAEKDVVIASADELMLSCSEMWTSCQLLYEECSQHMDVMPSDEASQ
jgi:hypothetical protein